MPVVTRLMLVVAVVALGATLVLTATGGLGRIVSGVGSEVEGMVQGLTATPTPRVTVPIAPDPPMIDKPAEPYTNQEALDIVVALPPGVPGSDSVVRLRSGLEEDPPVVQEVAVGTADSVVIAGLRLEIGRNDLTATIVGPGGESEPSPIVTYVLDLAKPKLDLTTPADGQTINGDVVAVAGQTQGRTTIVVRNGRTGEAVDVQADGDGKFSAEVRLGKGTNPIGLTLTDPAGNVSTHLFNVVRGEGKLTAELTIDPPGFRIEQLPQPTTLDVVVTDPDEKPLEGALVTFTLSMPGIQVVTSEATTGPDGSAAFTTTVPQGVTEGEAVAAVLVRTEDHGEATDSVELKVAP